MSEILAILSVVAFFVVWAVGVWTLLNYICSVFRS